MAQYGGNISSVQYAGGSTHTFRYTYDSLNRLTESVYRNVGSPSANGRYNERLTYDSDGNITQLKRWGKTDAGGTGLVDDVRFSYKGNQVVSATDHADAPTYMDAFHYSDDSEGNTEYAKSRRNSFSIPPRSKHNKSCF